MKRIIAFFNKNIKETVTFLIILFLFLAAGGYRRELFQGPQMAEVIKSILLWTPLIVTVAMGMMMVIIIGEIDLSVGSIVALSIMTAGLLFKNYNIPLWLGIIVSVLVGMACGAINGVLISYIRIPSIIVTLGTMNAYRGLTFVISKGKQITSSEMPAHISDVVKNGTNIGNLHIPWLVWISIVLVIIFYLLLKYTHFGREVYAVGSNSEAAYLRGIKCNWIMFSVFVILGALCGFAGYMYAARYGFINPSNTGTGIEFIVISATIIGGVAVNGGSGNVFGVFLGCILLATVNTLIAVVGIPGTVQRFCYGAIILVALLVDLIVQTVRKKRRVQEIIRKEHIA